MTLDGVPYIVTSAMAAAMVLSDMVMEKENEYAPVFYPSRTYGSRFTESGGLIDNPATGSLKN